jgi:uncharacterized membrane protein
MQDLGTLPGGTGSYAASINDLGVVTGTADGQGTVISPDSGIPNQECSDLTQPFIWTARTGMQGLGTVGVPPSIVIPEWCDIAFYGTASNVSGEVVGYTAPYVDNYEFAFLWTSAAGMSLFGTSFPPTISNAITDTGEIVGQTGLNLGEATTWKDGVETTLGLLGSGGYSGSANAATDWGEAVGWSTVVPLAGVCEDDLTDCPMHAVLWTRKGAISDLGTLPGDTYSTALGVNFFGQVIGSSGNALVALPMGATGGGGIDGGSIAVVGSPFLWTERKGMRDLNTLIRANSGWVLNSVSGINILGQIVGSGTLNGEAHGFLLTPRVPGAGEE